MKIPRKKGASKKQAAGTELWVEVEVVALAERWLDNQML